MNYKKQLLALALCLLALTGVAMAGSDDFLITLSWLEDRLLDPADSALDKGLEGMEADVLDRVDTALKKKNEVTSLTEAELDALASRAAAQMSGGSGTTTLLTASKGDRILGPLGAGMVLESGTATVGSFTGNDLIDVTAGTAAAPGTAAVIHHYYIVGADNGCGLTVTSDTATVRVWDGGRLQAGYTPKYTHIAEELSELGIFRGSNLGFELERVPTRQEALIMLLRLLGEEDEALAYTGTSPFTDLTGWPEGRQYIHYGAAKGYTNGITATTFNQYGSASRSVYLTYVLRALGYDDKAGDFVWNTTSDDLAVEIGLMTRKQLDDMAESGFYRDHVALISKNALTTKLKDGSMTLGERLAVGGDLSWDDYYGLQ